jgi:hypothetical protein
VFERRHDPLLSRRAYFRRLVRHALLAGGMLLASLGIGMAGYHGLEGLGWLDAYLNASMILSGMGPLAPITRASGKLFAGCYALFSGVAFLTTIGVLLSPVVHRGLHKFHIESQASER